MPLSIKQKQVLGVTTIVVLVVVGLSILHIGTLVRVMLEQAAARAQFAVESVSVFDVYQGKGLPEGKKSLAFALVFRAADRTLTDDEVNGAFTKIQDELAKTTGWAIRK